MHNISLVILLIAVQSLLGFPDNSVGKESTYNAGDPSSAPGEGISYPLQSFGASLVAQLGERLPAIREAWVRSLGWEVPLEKGRTTHSSILVWRIPWRATFTLCIDVTSSFLMSGTSSLTFPLFLIWFISFYWYSQTTEFWVGFPAFSTVLLFSVASTSSWSALFPFSCLLWADLHFFSYFS